MDRWLLIGGLALGCAEPGPPNPVVSRLEVTVHDGQAEGWLLTSVIPPEGEGPPVTGIVDREGRWVWAVTSPEGTYPMSAKVGRDGRSIVFGEFEPTNRGEDRGRMVRVPYPGPVQARRITRLVRGHHDFAVLPDGDVAYLSLDTFDAGLEHPVAFDRIEVVPEGASERTPRAALFDTLEGPEGPSALCDHVERPRQKFGERVHEWTHANSLVYVEDTDTLFMLNKWTDWLVAVDAATGRPRWVLNGPGSDFTGPDDVPVWEAPTRAWLWSHGHLSQVWADGLMVFDNGLHRDTGISALAEIAFDEDARTAERVFSYPHPEGLQTRSQGDARKLPSGRVLGSWADLGLITEVDRDGTLVWAAQAPETTVIGRTRLLTSLDPLVAAP